MFKKILIANRGEIACRVAATARRMAVRTVAVYADADASANHVRACDEAVHLGGSAPADSYLRWDRIIAAARSTGAEAIHPGYGFLSENEDFARACAEAGLVFIGPPPEAIQAMGLKAEAKRLMGRAGVPLVPGYHDADQDPARLQTEADRIGYPVLVKASAGGGGKGMRRVERREDFAAALASCQREARNSFGCDAMLIEKYVQRPRHIEIQIFGDTKGNQVYLFERDCSVQRRHQKVLEEAPAPGMTASLRRRMGEAAVDAARAVNYVGAGTVEFIVEQTGGYDAPEAMAFYFMEMNTRLQVEHPVTEAITGLDLVEWQLRVAAGESLPLTQDQLRIEGHAIEARICAENPDNHFLPATGTLAVYRKPRQSIAFERGPVRIDDGVGEGGEISPFYDSMIAKLIVHGSSRAEALARLDAALADLHIVGVHTNVQFLRALLATPSFETARLDTALIERERAVLFDRDPLGMPSVVAAAVAHQVAGERRADASADAAAGSVDPFGRRDGWRIAGTCVRTFLFDFRGDAVPATLDYGRAGRGPLDLTVGEGSRAVSGPLAFHAPGGDRVEVEFDGNRQVFDVYAQGGDVQVFSPRGAARITVVDRLVAAGDSRAEAGRLTAPMPGKVVAFEVKAGDKVARGQTLAVMEAMKMEHVIAAPTDGTVQALLFAPGDQVTEGAELLTFLNEG